MAEPRGIQADLADALEIREPKIRAERLLELIPRAPADNREKAIYEAMSAARDISDPVPQADVLSRLMPYLPPDYREEVLSLASSATNGIDDPLQQAQVLTRLIRYLPPDYRGELDMRAISAAERIDDPRLRAEAFNGLIQNLPPGDKATAVRGAISSAGDISDPQLRAETLLDTARSTPLQIRADVLDELRYAIDGVPDLRAQARLLGDLADLYAQAGLIDDAQSLAMQVEKMAEEVGDEWLRAQMLRLQDNLSEQPGAEQTDEATTGRPHEQPPTATEEPPQTEPDSPPREQVDIAARALADQWSEKDQLGFSDYATALADFIEDERTKKPLTIGIDAPWGMGKTTLMHMIERQLKEDRPNAPPLPTVWFNAWKHDKDESLWAALALEILRQVQEEVSPRQRIALWLQLNRERLNVRLVFLRFLRSLLLFLLVLLLAAGAVIVILRFTNVQVTPEEAWRYVTLIGGLGVIATLYNTIGKDLYKRLTSPFRLKIAEYVEEPNYEEKVGFLVQFEKDFRRVIRVVTDNGERPLVIFIDDLDRAAPPKPVEIFEAINMLLDSEHCVFILGMDSEAVAKSIEAKYKDLKDDPALTDGIEPGLGRRFLEKIVQIPVMVPRADQGVFRTFINENLEAGDRDVIAEVNRDEVVRAEKLIEAHQRQGSTLDEAAEAVKSETDVPTEAVDQAKVEIRAKSFGDSEEVRQAVADAVPYLEYNPRKVKRFINLFKLQALLANRRGLVDDGTVRFDHLAKWVIISTRWPTIVEAAISNPAWVERLLNARSTYSELLDIEDETAREQASRLRLEPLLMDPRVALLYTADEPVNLLSDLYTSYAQLWPYLYLSRVTTSTPQRS
jgi:hypothetical protein